MYPRRPERSRRRTRRGFTLVEIIVVVTIIALLATLVAPKLINQLFFAKKRVAEAKVKAIENAVNLYIANTGDLPRDDFDLTILTLGPDEGGPAGPYLKAEDLTDPWGSPYVIEVPGERNPDSFDIICSGPDRQLGTEDDIVN